MARFVAVASWGELADGELRHVEVDGLPICLCRAGDGVFAVRDVCTHQNYPLSDGDLEGFRLTCAAHGAQFDVRSGKVLRPPAYKPVKTYPARVKDGQVEVEV